MVSDVRDAMSSGLNPRMISTGTSGSYFVYDRHKNSARIRGVFKPMDEEPYGNLKYVIRSSIRTLATCLTAVQSVSFCENTFGGPWAVHGA